MTTETTQPSQPIEAFSVTYDFLTHPTLTDLTEKWMSGELLRHEYLEKIELLKDQVQEQHRDPHLKSGAV